MTLTYVAPAHGHAHLVVDAFGTPDARIVAECVTESDALDVLDAIKALRATRVARTAPALLEAARQACGSFEAYLIAAVSGADREDVVRIATDLAQAMARLKAALVAAQHASGVCN